MIDMSFMSKFLVQGADAGRVLDWLATARVDGPDGTISYTQFLSPRGTIEADLTVTKLPLRAQGAASEGFLVVATDTAHRHVEMLLRRGIEDYGGSGGTAAFATVSDVTGAFAQINLQGPRSRELLGKITSASVSDEAFPFRAARSIDIGCATLTATRITYVGELGYELFVPVESAAHVYDTIVEAGAPLGLAHAGLKALSSLRMEKGYRDYGHDLDNLDTLYEAGLGFTADYDKAGGFVGQAATLAQREEMRGGGLSRRMVQVLLSDPEPLMYHGEIVYRDGEVVGDVRSASYGHTLGGSVGLAMVRRGANEADGPVDASWVRSGAWEVDVAGTRHAARASLRPLYDPRNERIKGV